MRTIFFIIISLVTINLSYAQDTLYLMDGSKNVVKIIEVNATQIKYKLGSLLNASTYVMSKDDVFQIVFENGEIAAFPKRAIYNEPLYKEDPRVTDFGRNFISINLLDLFQPTLTLGYEYIFKSGKYGLKVPFSYRINSKEQYGGNQIFGSGLDFNYYPSGQGQQRLFFGPSFKYAKVDNSWNNNNYTLVYAFLIQTGFLVQPNKHFNISFNLAYGYKWAKGYSSYPNGRLVKAAVNIGYKF